MSANKGYEMNIYEEYMFIAGEEFVLDVATYALLWAEDNSENLAKAAKHFDFDINEISNGQDLFKKIADASLKGAFSFAKENNFHLKAPYQIYMGEAKNPKLITELKIDNLCTKSEILSEIKSYLASHEKDSGRGIVLGPEGKFLEFVFLSKEHDKGTLYTLEEFNEFKNTKEFQEISKTMPAGIMNDFESKPRKRETEMRI